MLVDQHCDISFVAESKFWLFSAVKLAIKLHRKINFRWKFWNKKWATYQSQKIEKEFTEFTRTFELLISIYSLCL